MRSLYTIGFVAVFAWFGFGLGDLPSALVAREIDPEVAIRLIEAKERLISSLRWHCKVQNQKQSSVVALDANGHFRYDQQGVLPLHRQESGKLKPVGPIGMITVRTWDGKVFREQNQSMRGEALPNSTVTPIGSVGAEGSAEAMRKFQIQETPFVYPFYFPIRLERHEKPVSLSKYLRGKLRQGLAVSIDENGEGLWQITAVDGTYPLDHPKLKQVSEYVHIKYAPGMGKTGALLHVVKTGTPNLELAKKHSGWTEISYEVEPIDGYYLTKRAKLEIGTPYPQPESHVELDCEFSNWEVNRPLGESDFAIDWKKGAVVTDDVSKKYYVVSGRPIDEKVAVDEYAFLHGLKVRNSELPSRSSWGRWLFFSLNIAVLCGIVGFVIYKYRRNASAAGLLLLYVGLSSVGSNCLAEDSSIAKPANESFFEFDDGWWRVNNGRKETRITQCGFYCTALCLTAFDVDFDPGIVSESLPVTVEGATLSAIRRILQAYGLHVDGRKNISFSSLCQRFPAGQCAICVIPKGTQAHFIIIGQTDKGVYIADPPSNFLYVDKLNNKTKNDFERALAARGGTMLFVSRGADKQKMADRLSATPTEVDLGDLDIADQGQERKVVTQTISLRNTSDLPLMVTAVPSCGCVTLSGWRNSIIDPKVEQNLTIEVDPTAWKLGAHREQVAISLPDLSKKMITVKGRGYSDTGTEVMRVVRNPAIDLQIPIGKANHYKNTVEFALHASPQTEDDLAVRSNASWVNTTMQRIDRGAVNQKLDEPSHVVRCDIIGSNELLNDLIANANRVPAVVTVTDSRKGTAIRFTIQLSRQARLWADDPAITFEKNRTAIARIRTNTGDMSNATGLTVAIQPEGLMAEVLRKDDCFEVHLKAPTVLNFRNFLVECQAEFGGQDRDVVQFTASLQNVRP